ncbi:Eco57I restriction-modification methylase domain-containing protein [Clostridioides difficile]|uniref:Eco57I restriction-modification methylase domain-containing protein n=1 Tax=Clostridioides difficile TaxID=1496 RepID=UPI00374E699A
MEKKKHKLEEFINNFNNTKEELKNSSEQTMRTWIDEFLLIFDWDCKNPIQVAQEKGLNQAEKSRLLEIDSNHSIPDYTLKNGSVRLNFLDAKDLNDNIKEDKKIAFQLRSYGWSASMRWSIVTNIEEIAFYCCINKPNKNDNPELSRVYFKIDDYLDNFEVLYSILGRNEIVGGIQDSKLTEMVKLNIDNKKTVDDHFTDIMCDFREKLAKNIYKNNPNIDIKYLNQYVQNIINRILFIRICEARGIEDAGTILNLRDNSFWDKFVDLCKDKYEEMYDGPLFTGIRSEVRINIDDNAFTEFIENLYDPSPYRFNVIPTQLLASMYERFLTFEICLQNNKITQIKKDFYTKQQGAVSTPEYMVKFVLNNLLNKLNDINSISQLLEIKILEPACGSGTFLIAILDYLVDKVIQLYRNGLVTEQEKSMFVVDGEIILPKVELKRSIINNCIYAVDMDYNAVDVAKMSLALKMIENYELPLFNKDLGLINPKLLLNSIGKNIIHGNTLIKEDIEEYFEDIKEENLFEIIPLNIEDKFDRIFKIKGGFDYIIGNPPYVETKNYIDTIPYCREYFRKKYTVDENKADMCIFFIERCHDLLNNNGKIAFICQRRFFKTNYGKKTREFIVNNANVDEIIEFTSTKIFKGRTTYIALLQLSKNIKDSSQFKYAKVFENGKSLEMKLMNEGKINVEQVSTERLREDKWNLGSCKELEELIVKLKNKFETIDSLVKKDICDINGGIQVLRKDVYSIINTTLNNKTDIIEGYNKRKKDSKSAKKQTITIEKEACRPIIANESLYKFKPVKPTYYAIVPYDNNYNKIKFSEFERVYPLCASYLKSQKEYIRENNSQMNDLDEWHTFTRETGLKIFNNKKILFPMTALEIVASYSQGGIYPDNSNMWGMTFENEEDKFHLAMTSVMNSKLITIIARHYSNPQDNGYRKFNKQFILPIPMPYNKMKLNSTVVETLANIALNILNINESLESINFNSNNGNFDRLENKRIKEFDKLNSNVYELFELNRNEIEVVEALYENLEVE